MPGKNLVDRVIDDFVDHVVQAGAVVGIADVHSWAFADRVQALEHLDAIGAVVVRAGIRPGGSVGHILQFLDHSSGHPGPYHVRSRKARFNVRFSAPDLQKKDVQNQTIGICLSLGIQGLVSGGAAEPDLALFDSCERGLAGECREGLPVGPRHPGLRPE